MYVLGCDIKKNFKILKIILIFLSLLMTIIVFVFREKFREKKLKHNQIKIAK